jgi:hypothetical protein
MKDLERVADMLAPAPGRMSAYHDDPGGFVRECMIWPPGQGPTDYQVRNMALMVEKNRLAVRSPHGTGKTTTNAWLVLWFALTRDLLGEDWKIGTTASAFRQLRIYLWPEIHKWANRLDWKKIGRPPFMPKVELMDEELRLAHGIAFAASSDDPAKIEGMHADQVLFIYDEAKTIPTETFDATEGAFMGAGEDTGNFAYAIASSTPGEPTGRFYEIHARRAGLEPWEPVHISLADAIKARRISANEAERLKRQWGADSALYINRVLGNFASREEDGVIPLSHIELAVARWEALNDARWTELGPLSAIGVDVATTGRDKTVFCYRHGFILRKIERFSKQDAMETAGKLVRVLRANENLPLAIVDQADAGVCARLKEQGARVKPFVSSHHDSSLRDITGQLEMLNLRAAAWWYMRDILDPENGKEVALPPDDRLIGDLVTPRHKEHSSGRIKVELKDEIRKRLGRSPDDGDACVYAFWSAARGPVRAPMLVGESNRWDFPRQRAMVS